MSSHDSTKVIVIALGANLGIAAGKFAGFFASGSASMLAEAIHSLVDCANQALLLVGKKRSARPPSELHPLGYGREMYFWSFVVAILLFSLGGMFAIYEGLHKRHSPEPVSGAPLGLGILAFAIVLEAYSFSACLKEVRAKNTFPSLWIWFKKTTSSDLLVIFTEDLAALLGLVLAALCLAAAWFTGNPAWDAYGSILVGLLLVVVAVLLAMEIQSLLIGEAPSIDYRAGIEELLRKHMPGAAVLRLLAVQTGDHSVLVSLKLDPGPIEKVSALIAGINSLERAVKLRYPEIQWQFIEPDTLE